MNDQAAALRQLKKLVSHQTDPVAPDPDRFLASIHRECRFSTILLIALDPIPKQVPPMQLWLPDFLSSEKRACIWDQAGLFSAGTLFMDKGDEEYPLVQHIETKARPLLVIPQVPHFNSLAHESLERKIKFIKYLDCSVGSSPELWITIPYSAVPRCQALVHAAEVTAILTPDHPEAIIRSYEAVKTLHLSGYFSPISILLEQTPDPDAVPQVFERINSVAKKFLSLDLEYGGMIISGNSIHLPKGMECPLRQTIERANLLPRQFMYSFAERLFYPAPGDKE